MHETSRECIDIEVAFESSIKRLKYETVTRGAVDARSAFEFFFRHQVGEAPGAPLLVQRLLRGSFWIGYCGYRLAFVTSGPRFIRRVAEAVERLR